MTQWTYEWNNGLVECVMGTSDIPPDEDFLVLEKPDLPSCSLWDEVQAELNEPVPVTRVKVRFFRVSPPGVADAYYREEGWME